MPHKRKRFDPLYRFGPCDVLIYLFLAILGLLCLLPLWNVLCLSFSGSSAAMAGEVSLWPVDFTLASYKYVLTNAQFWRSFFISVARVLLGVIINMGLTMLAAYPLSKSKHELRARSFYAWFLFIPCVVSGGLIPWYFTVTSLGLSDTIWALVLPGAVPVFNVFLLSNYMRSLPRAISESAYIDGAGEFTTLTRIVLPLCTPVLATLTLFVFVGHWNEWFNGLILMDDPANYPLQSYLQTIILGRNATSTIQGDWRLMSEVTDRTVKAAQIFIATVPVMLVYPFFQKHFTKGIVVGSVKE